jgi:hypothetical protein
MRIVRTVTMACVCIVAFAGISGGAAYARTPTPTATSTPRPSATATPMPTPTAPADQVSIFEGPCWLDGAACPYDAIVSASIDGNACGPQAYSITPADGDHALNVLRVPSREITPGCGYEGASIQFFIGNRPTLGTEIWHAGSRKLVTFFAGSPFAPFSGLSSLAIAPGQSIVPFIDGKSCGYGRTHLGNVDPEHAYAVYVFSDEQQAGCGREGAQVIFKLVDPQGNVIAVANQTAVWYAWTGDYNEWRQLDLTFGPVGGIKMGNVGTGDGSGESRIGSRLAVLLGLAGFAGVAVGFGFRRRATRR